MTLRCISSRLTPRPARISVEWLNLFYLSRELTYLTVLGCHMGNGR